tara:strand:- start:11773 stop:18387 length:6615 start_codon:yes stop_codon:yes gene_type:complete
MVNYFNPTIIELNDIDFTKYDIVPGTATFQTADFAILGAGKLYNLDISVDRAEQVLEKSVKGVILENSTVQPLFKEDVSIAHNYTGIQTNGLDQSNASVSDNTVAGTAGTADTIRSVILAKMVKVVFNGVDDATLKTFDFSDSSVRNDNIFFQRDSTYDIDQNIIKNTMDAFNATISDWYDENSDLNDEVSYWNYRTKAETDSSGHVTESSNVEFKDDDKVLVYYELLTSFSSSSNDQGEYSPLNALDSIGETTASDDGYTINTNVLTSSTKVTFILEFKCDSSNTLDVLEMGRSIDVAELASENYSINGRVFDPKCQLLETNTYSNAYYSQHHKYNDINLTMFRIPYPNYKDNKMTDSDKSNQVLLDWAYGKNMRRQESSDLFPSPSIQSYYSGYFDARAAPAFYAYGPNWDRETSAINAYLPNLSYYSRSDFRNIGDAIDNGAQWMTQIPLLKDTSGVDVLRVTSDSRYAPATARSLDNIISDEWFAPTERAEDSGVFKANEGGLPRFSSRFHYNMQDIDIDNVTPENLKNVVDLPITLLPEETFPSAVEAKAGSNMSMPSDSILNSFGRHVYPYGLYSTGKYAYEVLPEVMFNYMKTTTLDIKMTLISNTGKEVSVTCALDAPTSEGDFTQTPKLDGTVTQVSQGDAYSGHQGIRGGSGTSVTVGTWPKNTTSTYPRSSNDSIYFAKQLDEAKPVNFHFSKDTLGFDKWVQSKISIDNLDDLIDWQRYRADCVANGIEPDEYVEINLHSDRPAQVEYYGETGAALYTIALDNVPDSPFDVSYEDNYLATDFDGDGVPNVVDDLPKDPSSSVDADGDLLEAEFDEDDTDPLYMVDEDGDGVPGPHPILDQTAELAAAGITVDAFPNNQFEQLDTDGDGVGDNADTHPEDPNVSEDADGDGHADSDLAGYDSFVYDRLEGLLAVGLPNDKLPAPTIISTGFTGAADVPLFGLNTQILCQAGLSEIIYSTYGTNGGNDQLIEYYQPYVESGVEDDKGLLLRFDYFPEQTIDGMNFGQYLGSKMNPLNPDKRPNPEYWGKDYKSDGSSADMALIENFISELKTKTQGLRNKSVLPNKIMFHNITSRTQSENGFDDTTLPAEHKWEEAQFVGNIDNETDMTIYNKAIVGATTSSSEYVDATYQTDNSGVSTLETAVEHVRYEFMEPIRMSSLPETLSVNGPYGFDMKYIDLQFIKGNNIASQNLTEPRAPGEATYIGIKYWEAGVSETPKKSLVFFTNNLPECVGDVLLEPEPEPEPEPETMFPEPEPEPEQYILDATLESLHSFFLSEEAPEVYEIDENGEYPIITPGNADFSPSSSNLFSGISPSGKLSSDGKCMVYSGHFDIFHRKLTPDIFEDSGDDATDTDFDFISDSHSVFLQLKALEADTSVNIDYDALKPYVHSLSDVSEITYAEAKKMIAKSADISADGKVAAFCNLDNEVVIIRFNAMGGVFPSWSRPFSELPIRSRVTGSSNYGNISNGEYASVGDTPHGHDGLGYLNYYKFYVEVIPMPIGIFSADEMSEYGNQISLNADGSRIAIANCTERRQTPSGVDSLEPHVTDSQPDQARGAVRVYDISFNDPGDYTSNGSYNTAMIGDKIINPDNASLYTDDVIIVSDPNTGGFIRGDEGLFKVTVTGTFTDTQVLNIYDITAGTLVEESPVASFTIGAQEIVNPQTVGFVPVLAGHVYFAKWKEYDSVCNCTIEDEDSNIVISLSSAFSNIPTGGFNVSNEIAALPSPMNVEVVDAFAGNVTKKVRVNCHKFDAYSDGWNGSHKLGLYKNSADTVAHAELTLDSGASSSEIVEFDMPATGNTLEFYFKWIAGSSWGGEIHFSFTTTSDGAPKEQSGALTTGITPYFNTATPNTYYNCSNNDGWGVGNSTNIPKTNFSCMGSGVFSATGTTALDNGKYKVSITFEDPADISSSTTGAYSAITVNTNSISATGLTGGEIIPGSTTIPYNTNGENMSFGKSVALDNTGTRLVVCDPWQNKALDSNSPRTGFEGSLTLFEEVNGVWSPVGEQMFGKNSHDLLGLPDWGYYNERPAENFEYETTETYIEPMELGGSGSELNPNNYVMSSPLSIVTSGDKSKVIVSGASVIKETGGYVTLYECDGSTVTELSEFSEDGKGFGRQCSMSDSGDEIAIGYGDDKSNKLAVYKDQGLGYNYEGDVSVPGVTESSGSSSSLSGDGNVVCMKVDNTMNTTGDLEFVKN